MPRIIVGVSGASGMPLAKAVLRGLAALPRVETQCIVSHGAERVLAEECGEDSSWLTRHARCVYAADDLGAGPASGSWWHCHGERGAMLIVPCSMSTLGALASGITRNLVQRAADVCLKERLRLVLVTRESPLSAIHLRNMLELCRAGAVIMPFCPGFYLQPASLEDMLAQTCDRIFDQLGLAHAQARWQGGAAAD